MSTKSLRKLKLVFIVFSSQIIKTHFGLFALDISMLNLIWLCSILFYLLIDKLTYFVSVNFYLKSNFLSLVLMYLFIETNKATYLKTAVGLQLTNGSLKHLNIKIRFL